MQQLIAIPLLFVLLFTTNIAAQNNLDTNSNTSPKIGLVLSGGGAKGSAHIGVIKVLEEYGIRPDYITGTSMGSLVAAMYTLGYTTEQMDSIIMSIDWDELMADKIPLREISIFEKSDYPGYPVGINFNRNLKPSLPSGMIYGQKIQALHSKLVWKSNTYESFDDFPIPYRCVATDIISGYPHVFKDGNLAIAMRSSMSIPTVFAPIDIDTMLLIDGGVTVNYPVQQCIDLGADIIIGSYTGFEEKPDKSELHSMISILTRGSVISGIVDAKEQEKKTDVFIKPDLTGLSAADFDKSEEIINRGEIASRDSAVLVQLEEISSKINKKEKPNPLLDTTKIWVDRIIIEGSVLSDSARVLKVSGLKNKTYLTADDVNNAITDIYSSWQFNKVSYYFDKDSTENNLVIKLIEKSRGRISLGIHYDNSYGPNIFIKTSYKNLFLKSTLAEMKLSISENPRALINYKFYPTKNRRIELSLNGYFQLMMIPDVIKNNGNNYNIGHFVSTHIDLNTKLAVEPIKNVLLEAQYGKQLNDVFLKDGAQYYYHVNSINYNLDYYQLRFSINTLDNNYFPTKGIFINAVLKSTFNANSNKSDTLELLKDIEDNNYITRLDYKQYILIKKRFSIIPSFSFGAMESTAFLTEKFLVGGLNYSLRPNTINFPGVKSDFIATDNFIMYGIDGQYRFATNWYAFAGLHEVFFVDYAEIYSNSDFDSNVIDSWNVGLGLQSKLGPVRVIMSKSFERKEIVWSLNIGVPF